MKYFTFLLLAVSPGVIAQNVTDEVDRFNGARVIAYTAKGSGELTKPIFSIKAQVNQKGTFAGVSLVFVSGHNRNGTSWRFVSCHNVDWLVDGKPLPTGIVVHRGEVITGGVIEYLTIEASKEWMAAVAKASTVEYRVCSDEFSLTPADIAAFQVVVDKINGSPGAPLTEPRVPEGPAQALPQQDAMKWRPKIH